MKKTFILFTSLVASVFSAQALPIPTYEATFNGTNWNSSTGFTIETTNISKGLDPFNKPESAPHFAENHGRIQLDANDTNLRQKGTITFFAKYQNTLTSPSTVTPIGTFYPMLYLNNGSTSFSEGLALGFNHSGGAKKIMLKSFSSSGIGINQTLGNAVVDDNWHHYAIAYSFPLTSNTAGLIVVYQDGKSIGNYTITHLLQNKTKPFEFFGHTGHNDSTYKPSAIGALDEVRIYNDYLVGTVIKNIYTSYLTINSGNKIAKYSFNGNVNEHFGKYQSIYGNTGFGLRASETSQGGNGTHVAVLPSSPPTVYAELPTGVSSILEDGAYTISFASMISGFTTTDNTERMATVLSVPNTSGEDFLKIGMTKSTKNLHIEVNGTPFVYAKSLESWTHISISANKQNNTLKIYVDGELVHTSTYTQHNSLGTSHKILLGKNRKSTPTFAFSEIDDIVIDSKSYDATEVKKVYLQWKEALTSYDTNNATLATNDIQAQNHIKAYPNPTIDVVKLSERADIQIYDVSGRLIESYKNTESVDLSAQKKGIYILKSTHSKGTQSIKVIKK